MKTKQLDLEIERLKMLKNRNELTETGVELLNELIAVKKQLSVKSSGDFRDDYNRESQAEYFGRK